MSYLIHTSIIDSCPCRSLQNAAWDALSSEADDSALVPNRVFKNMWVGGIRCAREAEKQEFQAIVNATSNLKYSTRLPAFRFVAWVPENGGWYKEQAAEIESELDLLCRFVTAHDGCNILIHCKAGRHRAATCCALLLCRLYDFSVNEAIAQVNSFRKCADIYGKNRIFLDRFVVR